MPEALYYVHSFKSSIILLLDLNFGNAIKHEPTLVNTIENEKYVFHLDFLCFISKILLKNTVKRIVHKF